MTSEQQQRTSKSKPTENINGKEGECIEYSHSKEIKNSTPPPSKTKPDQTKTHLQAYSQTT